MGQFRVKKFNFCQLPFHLNSNLKILIGRESKTTACSVVFHRRYTKRKPGSGHQLFAYKFILRRANPILVTVFTMRYSPLTRESVRVGSVLHALVYEKGNQHCGFKDGLFTLIYVSLRLGASHRSTSKWYMGSADRSKM